jgi:hypothetical protein
MQHPSPRPHAAPKTMPNSKALMSRALHKGLSSTGDQGPLGENRANRVRPGALTSKEETKQRASCVVCNLQALQAGPRQQLGLPSSSKALQGPHKENQSLDSTARPTALQDPNQSLDSTALLASCIGCRRRHLNSWHRLPLSS